jgi:hypothetical protein
VGTIEIVWTPRDQPLPVAAVLGIGTVAYTLARVLSQRPELLAVAEVVVGSELMCIRAPIELLPWADGVIYLGREPAAPDLFIPTTLAPNVPAELLLTACIRAGHAAPLCVLPQPRSIFSLARARIVDPPMLDRWLTQ